LEGFVEVTPHMFSGIERLFSPRSAALFSCLILASAGGVRAADLYVGDFSGGNGSVNYFNATTGGFILKTAAPSMGLPGQMAIGPSGNLYVADQQGSIDVFNPATGAYLTQFGSPNLVTPSGLAFSPAGNLYVSDSSGGNGFIDEFDASGNFLGQVVNPSQGLDAPEALAFGPDGNLYIADQNLPNLYEYNLTTTAFGIFGGFGSPVTANEDLVFGPDGNLYVMSSFNGGTVYVFNGTTGTFISQFGNTSSALGAGALGMAFGPGGNMYVADSDGVDIVDGTTGIVTGNFIPVDGVNVINPTFLTFSPEPSTFAPAALCLIALGWLRRSLR
jgi:DNA-binding beta-propeller fold protein YncE